jgi:DNA-binding transcriptional MerR regulator
MKKTSKNRQIKHDLYGYMDQDNNSEPEELAGYHLIVAKITAKCLTSSDIGKIIGLSYRQIYVWERQQVRLAKRPDDRARAWRRFSIEDIFSFAILLALQQKRIPLIQNKKIVETIRSSPIVNSILLPIVAGKQTFLYHDAEKLAGFYIEGHETMFLSQILKARKPFLMVPLNEIFIWVLERSVRDDFRIEYDKETRKITFYLDNEPIEPDKKYLTIKERGGDTTVFKILKTSDQKDDNQNTIPGEPKPEENKGNR